MPEIDNLDQNLLKSLTRRISVLEKASGLGNAAISNGAQIVKDSEGITRARFGRLESLPGEFGAEVLVEGRWVPLASIATSPKPITVSGRVPLTAEKNENTGWAGSETLEARTFTGSLEITMSGKLEVAGNKASIHYGYEIRNQTGAVVVAPDMDKTYACTYTGAGMGNFASSSRVITESLPPGLYRITGKYILQSGIGEGSAGSITHRTLSVKAY